MTDYIKREDALFIALQQPLYSVVSQIKQLEGVDIVRCKGCRYWKWIEWAKEYRCTLRNTAFNARADDFCSYGEREGE